jgi:uncharacterized membrane protein YoaK (UPF0700 family)
MLLALTVVTGVVDAVSILALGRVFVANMTGNVVFIGFAVAGAAGFSLAASLVGLGGFLLGAGAGGRLVARLGGDRSRLFAVVVIVELLLLGVATVVVGLSAQATNAVARNAAVALLAVAMGMQNAAARHLAVPDLTTTVLTMTLTGIASDVRRNMHSSTFARRLLAVASMFGGAVLGAVLTLHQGPALALVAGTSLLVLVVVAAWQAVSRGVRDLS